MRIRPHRVLDASPQDVAVFQTLRRLLSTWRDDPERLAVAVRAYEMLGYWAAAWEVALGHGPEVRSISDDEAHALIEGALYRRNRRVLRNRAEGLILALRATAEDAEAWRLHQVREDVCVIECRELPIEERLLALRAKDD